MVGYGATEPPVGGVTCRPTLATAHAVVNEPGVLRGVIRRGAPVALQPPTSRVLLPSDTEARGSEPTAGRHVPSGAPYPRRNTAG